MVTFTMSIIERVTEAEAYQAAATEQFFLRVADVALRSCLSKDRIDEMQPVYEEICAYAGTLISFASDVRKHNDELGSYYPFAFELAELGPEDTQTDSALQRVLRKLSQTEDSEPPKVVDYDGRPVGISTWEINLGGVGMYVHRRRSLSEGDGEAPIYFTVENVSNRMRDEDSASS